MKLFIFTVQIPEHAFEERVIKTVEEKPDYILLWTTKELDQQFSGEFGWKKMGMYGVCALQYINKKTVRLIVKARGEDMAKQMVHSFAIFLDAKTTNKHSHSRRCGSSQTMMLANSIASRKLLTTHA